MSDRPPNTGPDVKPHDSKPPEKPRVDPRAREDDIADYLARTPSFFERHAELLARVQITSPHGKRAVSLQERQLEILRERIRGPFRAGGAGTGYVGLPVFRSCGRLGCDSRRVGSTSPPSPR